MPLEPVPLILKEIRALEVAKDSILAADDGCTTALFGFEQHDERTMNPPNTRLSPKELNVNIRLNLYFSKTNKKIFRIPIPLRYGKR
jgi:protein gp37